MSQKIENLITEPDLMELLGLSKEGIGTLRRERGLPYVKINQYHRIYLEGSVMSWLLKQELTLDKAEITIDD